MLTKKCVPQQSFYKNGLIVHFSLCIVVMLWLTFDYSVFQGNIKNRIYIVHYFYSSVESANNIYKT